MKKFFSLNTLRRSDRNDNAQVDKRLSIASIQSGSSRHSISIEVIRDGYNVDLSRVDSSFSKLHRDCLLNRTLKKLQTHLKRFPSQLNQLDNVAHCAPLHLAIVNSNEKLARALLLAGAQANLMDGQGKTPLIKAIQCSPDLVEMLLELGADPNLPDARLKNAPLHWAALQPQPNAFSALFKSGALDVRIRNAAGATALHLLASNTFRAWLSDASFSTSPIATYISVLVSRGCPINAQDECGSSALHIAATTGNESTVRALLSANVDVLLKNAADQTAAQVAHHLGHTNIVELLSTHSPIKIDSLVPGATLLRHNSISSDSSWPDSQENDLDYTRGATLSMQPTAKTSVLHHINHSLSTLSSEEESPVTSSESPPKNFKSINNQEIVNHQLNHQDSSSKPVKANEIFTQGVSENEAFIREMKSFMDDEVDANHELDALLLDKIEQSNQTSVYVYASENEDDEINENTKKTYNGSLAKTLPIITNVIEKPLKEPEEQVTKHMVYGLSDDEQDEEEGQRLLSGSSSWLSEERFQNHLSQPNREAQSAFNEPESNQIERFEIGSEINKKLDQLNQLQDTTDISNFIIEAQEKTPPNPTLSVINTPNTSPSSSAKEGKKSDFSLLEKKVSKKDLDDLFQKQLELVDKSQLIENEVNNTACNNLDTFSTPQTSQSEKKNLENSLEEDHLKLKNSLQLQIEELQSQLNESILQKESLLKEKKAQQELEKELQEEFNALNEKYNLQTLELKALDERLQNAQKAHEEFIVQSEQFQAELRLERDKFIDFVRSEHAQTERQLREAIEEQTHTIEQLQTELVNALNAKSLRTDEEEKSEMLQIEQLQQDNIELKHQLAAAQQLLNDSMFGQLGVVEMKLQQRQEENQLLINSLNKIEFVMERMQEKLHQARPTTLDEHSLISIQQSLIQHMQNIFEEKIQARLDPIHKLIELMQKTLYESQNSLNNNEIMERKGNESNDQIHYTNKPELVSDPHTKFNSTHENNNTEEIDSKTFNKNGFLTEKHIESLVDKLLVSFREKYLDFSQTFYDELDKSTSQKLEHLTLKDQNPPDTIAGISSSDEYLDEFIEKKLDNVFKRRLQSKPTVQSYSNSYLRYMSNERPAETELKNCWNKEKNNSFWNSTLSKPRIGVANERVVLSNFNSVNRKLDKNISSLKNDLGLIAPVT